ncbi:MAG: dipicolinate synthase subunit DpsA [Eubacteriales bacterium]
MSSYFVIGGDERMAHLADLLQKKHTVEVACMEELNRSSITDDARMLETLRESENIILPIPFTKDSVHIFAPYSNKKVAYSVVLENLKQTQTLFYGAPGKPEGMVTCACMVNFLENEKYAANNARLTAEVLTGLMIAKYRFSPYRKNILVLGYGRIAKILSRILQGMCAHVTIAARKEGDINLAQALGLSSLHIGEIEKHMCRFDLIINTVPKCVVAEPELCAMKDGALLIEIASAPYGVDFEAAKALKKNVVIEQGLPGKYMPALEAEALARIVSA